MNQRRIGVLLSYINMLAKNIVTFIYIPFLIRALGQSEYGLYQMSNSIISTLSILSLGFGSAYIRFFAQAKKKARRSEVSRLNGLYLLIFLTAALLSIALGSLLVMNTKELFSKSLSVSEIHISQILMGLMVFNVAVTFISAIFDSYIMANQEFRFQRSRQLLQTFLAPILTIPLLLLGYKAIAVVSVTSVITVFFLFLNIRFSIGKLGMRFSFRHLSWKYFSEIGVFSLYILANEITDQINWNIPNFLLGIISGAKSVAVFGVASQIKTVFINLSTTLSGVFVPQINEIVVNNDDNNVLTEILTKVGRVQAILVFYIFGGFLLLGKFFIKIWAGSNYGEAYLISVLLIIPLLVPLIQNVGIEIQRAKNRHKFRSLVYIVFAVANLGLTYLLINLVGIVGAALGGLITMLLSNGLIMNWYYSARIKLNMAYFWKSILKLMPQFLLPTVLLSFVSSWWVIDSFLKFLIYGVFYTLIYFLVYLKWGINEREQHWITQFVSRIRK
ncbi:putative membrane protein EpsK [Lacticaseibacillus paracasei]|uniref:lipopolysaccharide biosynthesis protein n=1 Tax=Lacticaseibacillus paracasei TaxID=1597 RepID=UPI000FED8634|nr:lipopolysaccharide biosynthesis protein [Lacticaseibacillus paracasei]RNE43146.1 putative membrane protein EpsK [Lacticaseibacillus paracasei]